MPSGRRHVYEHLDIFKVGLYSTEADYETEEFPRRDPKSTFLWIKLHPILSDHDKNLVKVTKVVLRGFGFYQYVIDVDFHISLQLVLENLVDQA